MNPLNWHTLGIPSSRVHYPMLPPSLFGEQSLSTGYLEPSNPTDQLNADELSISVRRDAPTLIMSYRAASGEKKNGRWDKRQNQNPEFRI